MSSAWAQKFQQAFCGPLPKIYMNILILHKQNVSELFIASVPEVALVIIEGLLSE